MKRERGSTINRVLDRLDTIAGFEKSISATENNEALNLTAITGKTITDKDQLLKEVEIIRKNKLSIDDEEYFDDIIAIAVPITGNQGRFYSSLAFQAPIFRLTLADAQQYIPRLRKAA